MKDKLKIIFMGTPEFAGIILEKLIASETYKPSLVITRPDKPLGRKQILPPPPVKQRITNKIKVLQPERLKDPEIITKIKEEEPDIIIVAAYGKIIPKEILDIPRFGILNVHASLLPLYRGASPISAAILNADRKTGATIMLIDEELDHGPILSQTRVSITPEDTTESLGQKMANAGADLLINIVPKWIDGAIKPQTQDHSRATYAKIIAKQDGEIKTEHTAEHIERMARAYYPWPGIYLNYESPKESKLPTGQVRIMNYESEKKRLKIIKIKVVKCEKNLPPLSLSLTFKKELCLHTANGCLILETVQPESKKSMSGYDFYLGNKSLTPHSSMI